MPQFILQSKAEFSPLLKLPFEAGDFFSHLIWGCDLTEAQN